MDGEVSEDFGIILFELFIKLWWTEFWDVILIFI